MPNKESEREMPVATIEELDAVDPGGVMTVRENGQNHEWRKRDDGRWEREGAALPSRFFVGSVAAGVVNLGGQPPPRPALGQVWQWQAGSYLALVFGITSAQDGERVVHLRLRAPDLTYVDLRRSTLGDFQREWTPVADANVIPAPQRGVLVAVGEQYMLRRGERDVARRESSDRRTRMRTAERELITAQRQIRDLEARIRELENEPAPAVIPDRWKQELTQYAISDGSETLRQILEDAGLLADIEHVSRVRIWGSSTMKPEAALGAEFALQDSEINWERTVEVVKTGAGCTCAQIDESDLDQFLPSQYNTWEWETECVVP